MNHIFLLQVVTFIEVYNAKFYTILVTEYLSGTGCLKHEHHLTHLPCFPGGDLFERLSPPDYHLTEDKCQLFIRQILQGEKFIHNK